MSSGYSASLLTGNGSGSASDWSAIAAILSSTSPVSSLGLTVSAERAATTPVRVTTLSSRNASAAAKSGDDTSMTHWVTP